MGYVRKIEDEQKYRDKAQEIYNKVGDKGDIYIPEDADVEESSCGPEGAYVLAYVWVNKKDI